MCFIADRVRRKRWPAQVAEQAVAWAESAAATTRAKAAAKRAKNAHRKLVSVSTSVAGTVGCTVGRVLVWGNGSSSGWTSVWVWVRAVNAISLYFPLVCVSGGQAAAIANDVALEKAYTPEDEENVEVADAAARKGRVEAARAWWRYQKAEHTQETARRKLKQVMFAAGNRIRAPQQECPYSPDVWPIFAIGGDPYWWRWFGRGVGAHSVRLSVV